MISTRIITILIVVVTIVKFDVDGADACALSLVIMKRTGRESSHLHYVLQSARNTHSNSRVPRGSVVLAAVV